MSSTSTIDASNTSVDCERLFRDYNVTSLSGVSIFGTVCPEKIDELILRIAFANMRNSSILLRSANVTVAASPIYNGRDARLNIIDSNTTSIIPADVTQNLPNNSVVVLSIYNFNPFVKVDASSHTDIISLSVLSENSTEISIRDTPSPISIGMNYNVVDGEELKCVWWDKSQSLWRPEGCQTDVTRQPVTCLCDHLTSFTLQRTTREDGIVGASQEKSTDGIWKWAVIGAGGFIVMTVMSALIIVMRKRKARKTHTEEWVLEMGAEGDQFIPTEHIELMDIHMSSRCQRAKFQMADVVLTRKALDGQTDLVLQRIRHINIVQYLGRWNYVNGDTYFVSTYIPGVTLYRWIEEGKYDHDMAKQAVIQLANVMAHLVEMGTKGNILTAEKVIVQSSDKGILLKLWDFRTHLTPPALYLAPERRDGSATEASQVWAFGILALQIMEKRVYPSEVSFTKYSDDVTSRQMEYFVKLSLQTNPKERPTFMELSRLGREAMKSNNGRGSLALGGSPLLG
ncbi:hypothetical protein PROFUN_11170 [Planoprotostelium fungivorum]|uniref:Uncharacterized protein n=1 Tax=Planoprotostelium fungivorum TaxID=1890364 RepID=A0A2P6NAN5_9EUKA|nr:hypothetical protein PROFUN_11170 [Planoprotostelium fungivorum]